MPRYADPSPVRYVSVDEDRAARRTLRLLAGALFVAVLAVVLAVSLKSLGTMPSSTRVAPSGSRPAGVRAQVTAIGPLPGVDIGPYVDNRRQALAQAKTDRLAVVSLNAYSGEAQARAAVSGLEVAGLLAAPAGTAPSVVTGDLATWARAQTDASRQEADEIRKILPTVDDPAFKAFYQSEIQRLDKAVKNVGPDARLIFAVVVRGPATALQQLATRPEVRLVDVADGADPAPRVEYRGLRPEEQKQANDPPVRPQ